MPVKKKEVNCTEFSNFDRFCSKNLQAMSANTANCFNFWGTSYWGFVPGPKLEDFCPQIRWATVTQTKIPCAATNGGPLKSETVVILGNRIHPLHADHSHGRPHVLISFISQINTINKTFTALGSSADKLGVC